MPGQGGIVPSPPPPTQAEAAQDPVLSPPERPASPQRAVRPASGQRSVDVDVDVDVVVDGDGDGDAADHASNASPQSWRYFTRSTLHAHVLVAVCIAHVAVAVAVNDHVNVNVNSRGWRLVPSMAK